MNNAALANAPEECPGLLSAQRFSRGHGSTGARTIWLRLALTALLPCLIDTLAAQEAPFDGIAVPAGFEVTEYAGDELAHDIHSLTFDTRGRCVVSGPGYIRILEDTDGDQIADRARVFAEAPASGSQGMFFTDDRLLCSGDNGLLMFRDTDGDDQADGPPEVFLKVAAGGEHHAHSIQRGPDGWWYVIAGNYAGVNNRYATRPSSPVRQPRAGVLMRLKPNFQGGEIVSHGYRNAYDFAFTASGDFFTWDSDGERDVSLPWYEPTRVFHAVPGSDAGWVSRSWKRAGGLPDMPSVTASFGRGSPTGVVCCRHPQFSEEYAGALFVLDWTFGKIGVVRPIADGAGWKSEAEIFASGRNQFGFAPTDAEFGPDGALYVSVGGRGTRGAVYRIAPVTPPGETPALISDPVDALLEAPQPNTSWSRAVWKPLAESMGREPVESAAVDETRPAAERVRAIEVLTELYDGPSEPTLEVLSRAGSAWVRARTIWSLGRNDRIYKVPADVSRRLIEDPDPIVQRAALEAVATSETARAALPVLARRLDSPDRHVRFAAAHLAAGLSLSDRNSLARQVAGQPRATIWLQLGRTLTSRSSRLVFDPLMARRVLQLGLDRNLSVEDRLDAVRVTQRLLGDVGPAENRPSVFDGYLPLRSPAAGRDRDLNGLRIDLAAALPEPDPFIRRELLRLIAMTRPLNRNLLESVLSLMTTESSATDDLHALIVLSLFEMERTYDQSVATARALLNVEAKLRKNGEKQDTNWDDRVGELYGQLCQVDPAMPQLLTEQPEFGEPGHMLFLGRIRGDQVPAAERLFAERIRRDTSFPVTRDLIFLLGGSQQPEIRNMIRDYLDNLSLVDAVRMVLAEQPSADDRPVFVDGLSSTELNSVEACLNALKTLPRDNQAEEQFALLALIRRLVNSPREFTLRELAVRLLQRNTGAAGGFRFGEQHHESQPVAMAAWEAILTEKYPDFQTVSADQQTADLKARLADADWDAGDSIRGKSLFEKLSCARCHGGRRALGPDLQGVGKRFTRADLLTTILDPNRDVSSRYRTTTVITAEGKVISGLIVYESVDGVLLRDANQQTYRIEAADIESQSQKNESLMPAGLLNKASAGEVADLMAYLQTL